ncbi:MAG: LytTR family transcriptional regulator DNA-binding domain-containing protein, partial [Acidaminococcaceae bacterium]|nr:LytTR family transcriptional regulator DNA-binding domain-containing protein [Acidaminococcaceae bacterium]
NKVREVVPWFNDTFVLTLEKCSQKDIPVSRHYIQEFKKYVNL